MSKKTKEEIKAKKTIYKGRVKELFEIQGKFYKKDMIYQTESKNIYNHLKAIKKID